jgi:hypothetical protein
MLVNLDSHLTSQSSDYYQIKPIIAIIPVGRGERTEGRNSSKLKAQRGRS